MDIATLRFDTARRVAQEHIIQMLYSVRCRPERDFVDVGSSIGMHTCGMASRLLGGRVLAIEPNKEALETLMCLVEKYGFSERVIVEHCAAGKRCGVANFTIFEEALDGKVGSWGNLSSLHPAEDLKQLLRSRIVEVQVATIDRLVDKHALNVQFMKLDIEGGEFDALNGSIQTLKLMRPELVFEDSGPTVANRYGYVDSLLLTLFSSLDYKLTYVTGHEVDPEEWLRRDDGENWRPLNIIATPAERYRLAELRAIIDRGYKSRGINPLWS